MSKLRPLKRDQSKNQKNRNIYILCFFILFMANEAIMVQQLQDRLTQVTVADGTGIEKGTLMVWGSDPNTAVASSTDGEFFCGIAAEEKVANDGQTELAVWTQGVFAIKITAGGTSVLGGTVKIAGANLVTVADSDTVSTAREVVGISLETGANGELVQVRLGYN